MIFARRIAAATILAFLVGVLAACAATRGNEEEISRLLSRLRRDPQNASTLRELGGRYALRASEQGYPSDIDDARAYLAQAEKLEPTNSKLIAWKGILRLVEAKIKGSKSFAREGLAFLDKAVAMDRSNLVLRMLRGSADLEVPREFNRADEGVSDLEMIFEAHQKDPSRIKELDLDPAEVHLKLGKGYRAKGDLKRAIELWQMASAARPGSHEAETAGRLLKKYTEPAGRTDQARK